MEELRQRIDVWRAWDNLCNALPMWYTEADVIQEFANMYNVSAKEVLEYFF